MRVQRAYKLELNGNNAQITFLKNMLVYPDSHTTGDTVVITMPVRTSRIIPYLRISKN